MNFIENIRILRKVMRKELGAFSKNYHSVLLDDKEIIIYKKNPWRKRDLNDINTKIAIYEDCVKEWFLNIADKLKNDNESGFVILQIAISYIEGNQQYRDGKPSEKSSKKCFRKGFRRIFFEHIPKKPSNKLLDHFYDQARCGLFHDGITKEWVVINAKFPFAINLIDNQDIHSILINPHKFLDIIKMDFGQYISELKRGRDTKLKENFKKLLDIRKNTITQPAYQNY